MLCLAAIGAPKSAAVSLDLTGLLPPVPDPLEGVINGAIFRAANAGAGGSGVFNPFVRLEDGSKPKDGVSEGNGAHLVHKSLTLNCFYIAFTTC